MMKKFISLWLVLCLVLCACGRAPAESAVTKGETKATTTTAVTDPTTPEAPTQTEADSDLTPMLYKISDSQGHVIWLFGTIHVGTEDMHPLPAYVTDAYNNAAALAVECDVLAAQEDMALMMELMSKLVYTDGTTISQHIPQELYTAAVDVMKDCGLYMNLMDMYQPVLWWSLIDSAQVQQLGYGSELGIDMYFLQEAKSSNKPIEEIESVQAQYNMLASFSLPLQILLLEDAVDSYGSEEYAQSMAQMIDVWCSGDEEAMRQLLAAEDTDVPEDMQQLYDEYNNSLLTARDLLMTDYAENCLKEGKEVFICVGAAHVMGENAMIDQLLQRGYTVEKIQG